MNACTVCSKSKSTASYPPSGLLQPLKVPGRPWSHILLDFITGLPPSQSKTTILTIIDRFFKAAHFIPLDKLPSSSETSDLLINNVFRLNGIPSEVVSDWGPQLIFQVWRTFCTSLGAKVSLCSGYHPQSNGQTERYNQEPEATLRCVSSNNSSSWSKQLPWIEYAHNTLTSSATGLSTFEASLGYHLPLLPEEERDLEVLSVNFHFQQAQRIWTQTQEALACTVEHNHSLMDRYRVPATLYTPG